MSLANIERGLREGPEVLDNLIVELEKRIADGKGIVEKGAPRVMLVMIPHDPGLAAAIAELGLAACVHAGATPGGSSRPVEYESLWEEVADTNMRGRGANYSSLAYITQLRETTRQWQVEGMIFFRHYSCRQYSIFPTKAKEIIENEFQIPVLLLDGDYCDYRSYNVRQMRTRLETFAEMVKSSHTMKEMNS
jgi:benzoyl-CoA reductase/2-hydroxyglutaryl-CoA dehydratase subunit BcrC/BadD/HgdB